MAIIIGKNGKKEWSKFNKYYFDVDGNYYELDKYGVRRAWGKTIDPYGFDVNGIHQETKRVVDTNYFDRDGYYWRRDPESKRFIRTKSKINPRHFNREGIYCLVNEKGEIRPTGQNRDPEGYDIKGLDINGFNRKGIHCITHSTVNEYGFNKDGFYCEKNENEEYVSTGSKYNPRGFKINKTYMETGKLYDDRKFNIDGINVITESELDLRGFNCEGIDPTTGKKILDITGFKVDKTYRETEELYDEEGYNYYGINKKGLDRNGNMPEEVRIFKTALEKRHNIGDLRYGDKYFFQGSGLSEYKKKYKINSEGIYKYICNVAFEQCPEIIERVFEEVYSSNPKYDKENIESAKDSYKKKLLEKWDLFY